LTASRPPKVVRLLQTFAGDRAQVQALISVHKLEKREREIGGESIVVVRVVDADGSVRQRP
jgi:hypothetical protein